MKYLKTFLSLSLSEKQDLSILPDDMMKALRKAIRKGAEDLSQDFPNALALVHKAYEETGVERPIPSMGAWRQYESNIIYAVERLAKSRGIDGSWRMSAAVFHESAIPTKPSFNVRVTTPFAQEDRIIEAENMQEIIDDVTNLIKDDPKSKECLVKVEKHNKEGRKITFWLHNAKKSCELIVVPNYSNL